MIQHAPPVAPLPALREQDEGLQLGDMREVAGQQCNSGPADAFT